MTVWLVAASIFAFGWLVAWHAYSEDGKQFREELKRHV